MIVVCLYHLLTVSHNTAETHGQSHAVLEMAVATHMLSLRILRALCSDTTTTLLPGRVHNPAVTPGPFLLLVLYCAGAGRERELQREQQR